jgi:TldD protein
LFIGRKPAGAALRYQGVACLRQPRKKQQLCLSWCAERFPEVRITRDFVRLSILSTLLLAVSFSGFAQQTAPTDPVMTALKQELNRSFTALKKQPVPPYFISYELTDNRAVSISSSFGAITGSNESRTRLLDIDLRVGDYKLDSSHPVSANFARTHFGQMAGEVPIENDPKALAVAVWLETDRKYRDAVQRLEAVKTGQEIKAAREDRSDDFSPATPAKFYEPDAPLQYDQKAWEEKVRRYGRAFRGSPDLLSAEVNGSGETETRRFLSTDGSEITQSSPLYRLDISASIKAADGEVLPLHRTFMSFTPEGMPSDETVLKEVDSMVKMLAALRNAPVAEAYTGPAILSGRASAVFFHEIFGHRVEGARLKEEDDSQTFKKKINQQVLPPFLSVYSDPTLRHTGATDLVGYYPFDDEGVKARRVTIVEKGTFKTFLMSRSPIEGFSISNGHGRRQQGYSVAARQSNLLVESAKAVPRAQLKAMLIEQVKSANKPYGLLFDDIEGGYTFTTRDVPNSFSVLPTVVYRIYPDGREELVRGLDLIGTPLIAFSKIMASDDEPSVFNGMCGAESGWVPVSAIAPGLLLQQIEVQRKERSQDRPPILPPPGANKAQSTAK